MISLHGVYSNIRKFPSYFLVVNLALLGQTKKKRKKKDRTQTRKEEEGRQEKGTKPLEQYRVSNGILSLENLFVAVVVQKTHHLYT